MNRSRKSKRKFAEESDSEENTDDSVVSKRPALKGELDDTGRPGTADLPDAAEGTANGISPHRIGPREMLAVVKAMKGYISTDKRNGGKKFLGFSSYDLFSLPSGVDAEAVKVDIRRYLKEATTMSQMSLSLATMILESFLAEGSSVTLYPDFPKKPQKAYNLFLLKRCGYKFDIKVVSQTSAEWRDEKWASERLAAEKEALEKHKIYLQQLQEFRESHVDKFTEAHLDYLDKTIVTARKMVEAMRRSLGETPPASKPKTKKEKDKSVQKTPFDLFVMSNANKYADLEPEKRQKKLWKKFNKLSDAEKQIYENLAKAL